jgi:hypothetical protein
MPRPCLVPLFVLLVPAAARPDDVTDLRDLVLKAAAKDPADIQKFKAFTLKAKGTSLLGPEPAAGSFELVAVYPGKLKVSWVFGSGDAKTAVSVCASDDKGWRSQTGVATRDMTVEELNDLRTDTYGVFASTLLALTEPETKLSAGGQSKVGGDPVVGLKLSRRPFPEVTLYFDEKTYLLRKMAYRGRENGVVVSKEMIFGGHKEVGGLMLPTTQSTRAQGEEKYSLAEIQFSFPDRLDLHMFEKPSE